MRFIFIVLVILLLVSCNKSTPVKQNIANINEGFCVDIYNVSQDKVTYLKSTLYVDGKDTGYKCKEKPPSIDNQTILTPSANYVK